MSRGEAMLRAEEDDHAPHPCVRTLPPVASRIRRPRLRTVRLVLDLEADRYEILYWSAKRIGFSDLAD